MKVNHRPCHILADIYLTLNIYITDLTPTLVIKIWGFRSLESLAFWIYIKYVIIIVITISGESELEKGIGIQSCGAFTLPPDSTANITKPET